MTRTLLWIAGGTILGLILHLAIILARPTVGATNLWTQIGADLVVGEVTLLPPPAPGAPNPLGLDPEIAYATCRFDLAQGPGVFSGTLPADFWSISIVGKDGVAIYSTTSRAGVGNALQLGLFNRAQTRLLAEQQFEIEEGLLIVEAPGDDVLATIRLAVPHPTMHKRYQALLSELRCGHLEDPGPISETSSQE